MKILDLEKKYQDFIIDLVSKIVPEVEIFIYGSRTKGKALKYSDVDIALKCDKEIPFDNILRLKALFSDSTFPYMVDIIDLNSISEKFFSLIKDDLIKIN